jgi:hypothetical protein
MRALKRLVQVGVLCVLVAGYVSAYHHGRAGWWLLEMQLVGIVGLTLLSVLETTRRDPRVFEDSDGGLGLMISVYLREWEIEGRSWWLVTEGSCLLTIALTTVAMLLRQTFIALYLIEALFHTS